ncbi:MAG TPA: hypothetical protein DDY82_04905 [Clostridiales bacterium]|nr:hypothetical protein [Clostridiales bacterium]
MLKDIKKVIKELNSGVQDKVNTEKAIKIKKKLLYISIPLIIIGIIGVIVSFVLFATAGRDAFTDNGFSVRIIIPMVTFIACGLISAVGFMLLSLALKIVVTQFATNLISEGTSGFCPQCHAKIEENSVFCTSCGKQLKKQCSCGQVNNLNSTYCSKCGKKLD